MERPGSDELEYRASITSIPVYMVIFATDLNVMCKVPLSSYVYDLSLPVGRVDGFCV